MAKDRIERYVRHGLRDDGWLLVSTRIIPACDPKCCEGPPTTWAMQGMLDLVLRGGGLREILPEAGVLLGFAAIFFSLGVWRFRYE